MSRSGLIYSDRRASVKGEGFNPDVPVARFYRFRMRSGGMLVGVRIWFGAPLDPVTREELDRSHRWNAAVNGRPIDLERVWPACAGEPTTAADYEFLSKQQAWGEQHAPDSAYADPLRKVDLLSSQHPMPF